MALKIEKLNYVYSAGNAYEVHALKDIDLEIPDGEFMALIGHTGSGKSTLVQHLNGLLKATSGAIYENGKNIYDEDFDMRALRSRVGLVFQYPEYQLFEETVLKDVMFGPKNLGLDEDAAREKALEALRLTGVDEEYYDKAPFELSGGQKRRVAIAGIVAMEPQCLVLDEPTAGLDPHGRDEILNLVRRLHSEKGISIVLVSHSMEDVANYASRIVVMNDGKILYDDVPAAVFEHWQELEQIGLSAPEVTYVMQRLKKDGWDVDTGATTIKKAKESILASFGTGEGGPCLER